MGSEELQSLRAIERKLIILTFLVSLLSACGVARSDSISKIALLAPFEGRYRQIGYNALYSVRLALQDSDAQNIHLLAVDDGGTVETASDRIRALNIDPDVSTIIVLGQFASDPDVQQANDKPLIIIGNWGHSVADDDTLSMSHPNIADREDGSVAVNDLYILEQVQDTVAEIEQVEIPSSGSLPSADFRERYLNSDQFVPEPNLLATLTYDVSRLVIEAIQLNMQLSEMRYSGINGEIRFEDGYWVNAPIHRYRYQDGELILVSG